MNVVYKWPTNHGVNYNITIKLTMVCDINECIYCRWVYFKGRKSDIYFLPPFQMGIDS